MSQANGRLGSDAESVRPRWEGRVSAYFACCRRAGESLLKEV